MSDHIPDADKMVSVPESVIDRVLFEQGYDRTEGTSRGILSALSAAGLEICQGWQPIETAPRDGTPMLLWFPLVSGGQPSGMRQGRWNGKNDMFPWDCGAWSCQADAVTHWRPLPDAPEARDDEP